MFFVHAVGSHSVRQYAFLFKTIKHVFHQSMAQAICFIKSICLYFISVRKRVDLDIFEAMLYV